MVNLTVPDAYNLYKCRGWLLVPGAGVASSFDRSDIKYNDHRTLTQQKAVDDNICFDPFLLPLLKWHHKICVTIHVVNEKILIAGNVGGPFSLTGYRSLELLTDWQTGQKFTSEDIVKIPVLENGANDSLAQCVLVECGLKLPDCPAFIVKGRGLFVWGDTIENTMEACDAIVMMIGVILKSRCQPN